MKAYQSNSLSEKYRTPAPRYTSYPTVPFWDNEKFTLQKYLENLHVSYQENEEEISLYIHLPFCEDLCTYCGCNTRITKNHSVELPYINAVLKEWQMYQEKLVTKPTIKEIHLGGGTPTFFSPENLELLIKGILSNANVHQDAVFSFEGHPKNTSVAHLSTLHKLGFNRISLGIQDFDPKVQAIINRVQSFESVEMTTLMAREMGYDSINYDLIYGLPLQSIDGLAHTIDQVIKLKPDRIAFYSYAHVPWIKPGQRRYNETHLPSAVLKRELYEIGRSKLLEAGYAEIGMDHFILPADSLYSAAREGKLHRNFMGYTEQKCKVMIGLGVSSISDCWNAFAQNVKTVEEYLSCIDQHRFPIVKGHILTKTDLIFRQHILNLMCKDSTTWLAQDAQDEDLMMCLERASELERDGLIQISAQTLNVTKKGKRFLRNICMTFDLRLWEAVPSTQLFSLAD
ncbi:oxygen-independent coproporphyrinogen III oxidase [Pedobacter sp. PWIIR3]